MPTLSAALSRLTRPVVATLDKGLVLSTSFWFRPPGWATPALVTTAHGLEGARRITLPGEPRLDLRPSGLVRHPDPDVDLALLVVEPRTDAWMEAGWVPEGARHDALEPIEPILVLGHPLGLGAAGQPVTRTGITATDPRRPHHGRPEFLIDVPCYPGTSGSPVLRYRPDDAAPVLLLGVVIGGPALSEDARTGGLADWPKADTFHLGVATDARHLLGFQPSTSR